MLYKVKQGYRRPYDYSKFIYYQVKDVVEDGDTYRVVGPFDADQRRKRAHSHGRNNEYHKKRNEELPTANFNQMQTELAGEEQNVEENRPNLRSNEMAFYGPNGYPICSIMLVSISLYSQLDIHYKHW